MTGSFEVKSVEETWELAKQFARELKPGDVVCLEGDLGAGKTTFTQGLAAALGVRGRVTSPTFCIVQEHAFDGDRRQSNAADSDRQQSNALDVNRQQSNAIDSVRLLVHMDLYRLHGEDDVIAIGWEDYLSEGAVLVVEWPERAGTLIPESAHHIAFHHLGTDDESRRIEVR